MKRILLISGAYISAVIGAGFASGSEIILFFLQYGKWSFCGILLSSVMFGLFASVLLSGCLRRGVHSFSQYTQALMGRRLSLLLQGILAVFMLIILGAMCAASGEMAELLFHFPGRWGALLLCLITFLMLLCPERRLMDLSGIIGAFIIAALLFSCWYMVRFRFHEAIKQLTPMAVSAVSYTCYNFLSSAVLLCEFSHFLKSRREAAAVGILSGGALFLMLLGLWVILGIFYKKVPLGEIPMLTLARRYPPAFAYGYGIVLFLSIVTTASANGFGFMKTALSSLPRPLAAMYIAALALMISGIGFSSIIDKLYRLCGYCALLLPICMLKDTVFSKNTDNKRILKKNREID